MIIKSSKFLLSVVKSSNFIKDGIEFAFVGRSNVGKSSFINALVNKNNLAKTSSLPGRTRMINYFLINDAFRFVDLPGYGYHKAGKQNVLLWASLMEDYLNNASNLKRVFMLVDIRHKPTDLDKKMLTFLTYKGIPFKIVATKADKIAKSKIFQYINQVAKELSITALDVIPFSSKTLLNKDKILNIVENDILN